MRPEEDPIYDGSVLKAFGALAPPEQSALEHDIRSLIAQCNRSGDGSVVVPSAYLEVVVTRH